MTSGVFDFYNSPGFPKDFVFELTKNEKDEPRVLGANCDRLNNLVFVCTD